MKRKVEDEREGAESPKSVPVLEPDTGFADITDEDEDEGDDEDEDCDEDDDDEDDDEPLEEELKLLREELIQHSAAASRDRVQAHWEILRGVLEVEKPHLSVEEIGVLMERLKSNDHNVDFKGLQRDTFVDPVPWQDEEEEIKEVVEELGE